MKLGVGLLVLGIVALSLGLAFFVSPHASEYPDGLEKVAQQHNFADLAEEGQVFTQAPLSDYKLPGIEDEKLATGLAGVVGTLGVLAFALGIGKLLAFRRRQEAQALIAG